MQTRPPRNLVVTDDTRNRVFTMVAFFTLLWCTAGIAFYIYQLAIGQAFFPAILANSVVGFGVLVLTALGTYLNGMLNRQRSDRNARETQARVTELTDAVQDGFPKVVAATTAALVDVDAKKTAAELAAALALTTAQQAAEVAVQKQRDDQAAMHAKINLLLERLAALPAPTVPAPAVDPAASTAIVDAVDRTTAAAEQIVLNTIGPIPVVPVTSGQQPAEPTTPAGGE